MEPRRSRSFTALALLVGLGACATTTTGERGGDGVITWADATAIDALAPPVIGRAVLFGNPTHGRPRITPDGQQLAFLAPADGVLNVWVGPLDAPERARPVTASRGRGIHSYAWAYTNAHILFSTDRDGDEDWRLHVVDLATGAARELTPTARVQARILRLSYRFPTEVLVGLNDRDPRYHDAVRVQFETGDRERLVENPGFEALHADDGFVVRLAERPTADGGKTFFRPVGSGGWKPLVDVPLEDGMTTTLAGFDGRGRYAFLFDSRGRDKAALTAVELATGQTTLLAASSRADIDRALLHPVSGTPQAVSFARELREWRALDADVARDLDALHGFGRSELAIESRSLDDRRWIVTSSVDDGPARVFRYDRDTRRATFLFADRPDLEGLPLARMHPVTIRARDGLDLVSYLTLPPWDDRGGRPSAPRAAVLFVHGGPWWRDSWGLRPPHQLLANRGYAVLSVNFRGSTGFGKAFVNAGDREWGRRMHEDLVDALRWLVAEGIAREDAVAIMGGSYGGYAALAGLAFTPETFACAVDAVGPSNLITLIESIPPYWRPAIEKFAARIGDPRTEEGRALLRERSPLTRADRIRRPLLIGQGATDPRVKRAEADQIVQALAGRDVPVVYALFGDEGHGFKRPENEQAFWALSERFLAACLGGRAEPFGDALRRSSVRIEAGRDQIPGLAEALAPGGR